ncbi:RNA-directed DNA polymerase from mobile element jockey [Trichonephila clavipes]|nr:RNA-directed DNA polymerase from mobile element jockey [Trichonephila clavipes]
MANYSRCPLYPKPRKGTNITPNNYATALDNLIRPNTSFAQAVTKSTNNSRNPQQMAAPSNTRRNPAIFSQKRTNQIVTPTPTNNNITNENNSPQNIILQTLQQTIQALTLLTQQVSNLNFNNPTPKPKKIKETHLRPKYNINIPNYICYRNDRDTGERARGGTLILIRRNFPHYNLPTPPLQHIEATIVVLTPPNFNPISIASVYVPPKSDERLFTLDFEQLLQTNSNCVIFGDLNATHNEWNCLVNSTRGKQLKTFTDTLNLTIAYPSSPTRFGHGTSNTLDIAVINNFNFLFTMDSIPELSSDHNPVFLNFSLTSPIHQDNARAVTTCCSSGPACSDDQKANLLAITLKDNFTENERPNGDYPIDNTITTTLENFFSHPHPFPLPLLIQMKFLTILKLFLTIKPQKPGKNSKSPSSYRPISLLSILSKITEHIILNRLHNFTDSINYINPNQYGFTRHLSTYHPLLRLTEKITSGFQRGRSTGAVFLDIQKAFDRVWFGLAIHQNDHQARRRFVEWAQNEIAVVPDFHKRILFSDEAHFWLNGYVNKQNCRIWSETNPQVYVETPLHPEKLTVVRFMGWWNHWSVLLQKR